MLHFSDRPCRCQESIFWGRVDAGKPEGTARRARSTSGNIPVPSQAAPPASPAQGPSRAQACNNPSKRETCSLGCSPLSAAGSAERGRDRLELPSFPSPGAFPPLPLGLQGHRSSCCCWYLGSRPPSAGDMEPGAAEKHSPKIRVGRRQTQLGSQGTRSRQ